MLNFVANISRWCCITFCTKTLLVWSKRYDQLRWEHVRVAETKNQLQLDLISLFETEAILNRDFVVTVRERNSLQKMPTELVNFLPVDRHCPLRDQITQGQQCLDLSVLLHLYALYTACLCVCAMCMNMLLCVFVKCACICYCLCMLVSVC